MESLSHPQLLNSADCLIKNHPVAICTRRLKTQTTNNGHLFYEPRGVTNPRQCRETFPNIFTKLNSLKSLEREVTNMGGVWYVHSRSLLPDWLGSPTQASSTGRKQARFHKYFLGNKFEHLNLLSVSRNSGLVVKICKVVARLFRLYKHEHNALEF